MHELKQPTNNHDNNAPLAMNLIRTRSQSAGFRSSIRPVLQPSEKLLEIQKQIKMLRKSGKSMVVKMNPELKEEERRELQKIVEKHQKQHDHNCDRNTCAIIEFNKKVKLRIKNELSNRFSKLLTLESKRKQSGLKWQIERQVNKLKDLEEKKELERRLIESRKDWERQNNLRIAKKRQEMALKHGINQEKFEMLRKSKRNAEKAQKDIVAKVEIQSWRDMKFKQQNNRRLEEERKQLKLDYELRRVQSVKSSSKNE